MDNLKNTANSDSAADSSASSADSSSSGFDYKKTFKDSSGSDLYNLGVDHEISDGDLLSAGSDAFFAVAEDGFRFGHGADGKIGNDSYYISSSTKNEVAFTDPFIKGKRSLDIKNTTGVTAKAGLFEYSGSSSSSIGYTSGRITTGQGTDHSVKIGNEDVSATFSGGQSSKFGKGYSSNETHYGANFEAGPVEVGAKHTSTETFETKENDKGEEVKTESQTEKNEVSGGLKLADGVKVKGTVATEEKKSFSQSESGDSEEKSSNISTKMRVEVDSEKAGFGAAAAAAMFNASQLVTEAAMKEATTTTTKVDYPSAQDQEAQKEAVKDIEAQNKEVEQENQKAAEAQQAQLEAAQAESYDYDYGYGY